MRFIFVTAFFFLASALNGQVRNIVLMWEDNDTLPYFKSAVYTAESENLPFYKDLYPWPYENLVPEVRIHYTDSDSLKINTAKITSEELPVGSPKLNYQLVYQKNKPYLQISVLPVYIDPVTGKALKISAFKLDIKAVKPLSTLKYKKKGRFLSSALLAENEWFKISVQSTGMHKLTYSDLVEIGLQNPSRVNVFGAGAILLPEDYSKGYYDDLQEVPVYVHKGEDQQFGPGDFILFFATGPVQWKYSYSENFFNQKLHPYSNYGYYFLTEGIDSALEPKNGTVYSEEPDQIVTNYDLLSFFEEEKYNLINSGKEWYGDNYNLKLSGAYPFTLNNLVNEVPLKIKVTGAIRSNENSSLRISANNSLLGSISSSTVNLSDYATTYAINETGIFEYTPPGEIITVQVEYQQPNTNSEAWLNYITINARASLDFMNDELIFRDSRSVAFGNLSEFRINKVSSELLVWDITAPNHPLNIPFSRTGNLLKYKIKTDSLREFIAFNPLGDFPTPDFSAEGLGKIENQNLHGTMPPDMLIIYPEEFYSEAERLAQHRREFDGMDVLCVTQEMIFNEFSSGTPDVTAIRNYLKMYYDQSPDQKMVNYLLLFGDGSFDNRDTASYNPNLILTYQSDNSLVPTASFVSDDYFGLLDTGEGLFDGLLDIGIGRLPVSTLEEAKTLVDKIIEYDQPETLGEWRNYICLIGDDEDGNIHMKQANSLANSIENKYPGYNVNRIFLDAYTQQTTPTGDKYPEVTRIINDQINRGALIINYTGHGGVTGLAHEKIVDVNNIKSWTNKGKYPLFMTATCEFSRYDGYNPAKNSEISSAGEEVLLNPSGGGIALFTTTRLVYSGPNHTLNEKFYEIVFKKKENGDCYRLGDIILYSKNNSGSGINKRNFTLLGDPSVKLSFPQNVVVTDSVNNTAVEQMTDTISALDFVTVSGHLEDQHGNTLDGFNGMVVPVVYDKKTKLKTLTNDGGIPFEFESRNSILYKGNVLAENGKFKFGFYVPKDIHYRIGAGKISYYGYNETTDAHGSLSDITIGGFGKNTPSDKIGPKISLYMNDTLFRDGGIVTKSPELLVFVKDDYGINTTGNGIGHDITATLNDDRLNSIILNEYYIADINSYSSGEASYQYNNLPMSNIYIEVKVWDIFNNSASEVIDFIVVESEEMLIKEIYNYPNPFSEQTWFNVEHNRPDQQLEVEIRIYALDGNLVYIIQNSTFSEGYRLEPPSWEGNSVGGATLSGGLYVYKVLLKSESGERVTGSGKLIIKR